MDEQSPAVNNIQENKPTETRKDDMKYISDLFEILGAHSPYYAFSLSMNALMFALFNHLNEMDTFLVYSENDQIYTDDRGTIIAPQHPTVIDENGKYGTSNGAMDLDTLTILNNISSMAGCLVTILIARWSYHKSVVTFTVLIVASFLLSQAFLFNFFDRIAFVIGCVLSKSLSITTIQAAFESGQGKYRVWAIGFCYYLSNFFVFVTILLYKKDKNYAETHFMFLITALTGLYTLMCPSHLLHSVVRRDVKRVQKILDKFGNSGHIECSGIVDDVLYINRIPTNVFESLGYLYKIKPFLKKIIVLTIMLTLQTRLNSGEMEMIRTMLPYSPMESLLISRIIACCSSMFAVYGVLRFGRRSFLVSLLFLNIFVSYAISLVPIDTFYACYSRDMPSEEYDSLLKFCFFSWTAIRTCSTITITLLTLEHIPTIHRAFVYPVVMFFDSVIQSAADSAPEYMTELHDNPTFIRPMIRYSIMGLLIAVIFIDDSDVSVFHTNEIACYNLTNPIKKKKKFRFEDEYRTLCEVKALELESYETQQHSINIGYHHEKTQYGTRKAHKMGMKKMLKDSSMDSSTRDDLVERFVQRQERNSKCVEAAKNKRTRYDRESKTIVHHIQKNRLKL